MKRTKRMYDLPWLYRVLKLAEPTVRLWAPMLFRSDFAYGFRLLSAWDRMLLRISAKERADYDESLTTLAGQFEGLEIEWITVGVTTSAMSERASRGYRRSSK